ncbi:hypothetical protein B0I37DRAFT_433461 [Chaetomium sp. MPI-CAGE-AT-0009]|nr:hypothetical protein B0I37DRAFT_433461 [Chaetomium sp. MPI-CAGE-AT-0009]
MDAEMAKALLDEATEEAKDLLANELYYRELKTIRREHPLLDSGKFLTQKLALYDRNDKPGQQPPDQPGGPFPPTGSGNINKRGGAAPSEPLLSWDRQDRLDQLPPRLVRVLAKVASVEILEDSDSDGAPESQVPGPLSNMRLDIPEIRRLVGHSRPLEEEFPEELEAAKADFLTAGYEHMDQESMFQGHDWLGYLRSYETRDLPILFKGFPMVEDVVFVKHPNYWQRLEDHGKLVPSGQCYWLAVALLIYGNASFWLRVKAEHLSYLEKVLANPNHPRHKFYDRENQNSMLTQATGPAGKRGVWSGTANLWETLHIPGCWTSEDMCQLTADVYGVSLVLYKFDSPTNGLWKNKIYDMKTYGAYNSRHIFLCYTSENHYQPMVPNEFYSYEFKLPRLTLQNTKKYRLLTGPRHRNIGDGPSHHWRGRVEVIPSTLALPGFKPEHLSRAVGEPTNVEKVEAALLANPELLRSPQVAREVASLIVEETSGGLRRRLPTQADAQAARQAMRVIQQYIDRTSGSQVTESGRHPLPSSRSSSTAPTPRDKGKRPATDPAGPSTPAKRLRTPPVPPPPPPPAPPPPSRIRIKKAAGMPSHALLTPPSNLDLHLNSHPNPHDNLHLNLHPNPTPFYRPATRSLLIKTRIARLRKWLTDLGLVAATVTGDELLGWKKEECGGEVEEKGGEEMVEEQEQEMEDEDEEEEEDEEMEDEESGVDDGDVEEDSEGEDGE